MAIKMRALRTFGVAGAAEGKVRMGRDFTVEREARARELEKAGLATRDIRGGAGGERRENRAAQTGPLSTTGGQTGAGAQRSSSPPARAQPRKSATSSRRKG